MNGSKSLSRSAFLEVSQERVPGRLPGTRFWGVSRNAKFEKWKVIKGFMKWQETNFQTFFFGGGTMWNKRHFTPPPSIFLKVCFHIKLLEMFFLYRIQSLNTWHLRRVPWLVPKACPGVHSWKSPRSAFLEVFQERVPGVCSGTRNLKNEKLCNASWNGEKQILRLICQGAVWNNRHFPPPLWDGVK